VSGQAEFPAVARWRVRHALRKAREAKGLTQTEVADHFEWSLSKVQRIEAGDVSVSVNDLRQWLDLVGVADAATVADLLDDARISRRQRWAIDPLVREHLTPNYQKLMQFEAVATEICYFQTEFLPGIMQTRAYAEAVIRFYGPTMPDEQRRVRIGVRMDRRAAFFDRADPADLRVVLAEPTLKIEVGGPDVMAEQLRDLAELARLPFVRLRVLPLADEALLLGAIGAFIIVGLGDDEPENAVLYRETINSDSFDDDHELLGFHRGKFDEIWEQSLPEDTSIRKIIAEAAAFDLTATGHEGPGGIQI
jgi:transcriptional regulator with XRE-family HTH domain